MDNPNSVELSADALGTDQISSRKTTKPKKKPSSRKGGSTNRNKPGSAKRLADKSSRKKENVSGKGKTKKDQLIALLSKPNGARLSVLVERLEWQSHSVRSALSGLRKQGFAISTSKSAKGGEAVYAITSHSAAEDADKPASAE